MGPGVAKSEFLSTRPKRKPASGENRNLTNPFGLLRPSVALRTSAETSAPPGAVRHWRLMLATGSQTALSRALQGVQAASRAAQCSDLGSAQLPHQQRHKKHGPATRINHVDSANEDASTLNYLCNGNVGATFLVRVWTVDAKQTTGNHWISCWWCSFLFQVHISHSSVGGCVHGMDVLFKI